VVSRRVVELFARHKITGPKFSAVRPNQTSSAESKDWFQLTVEDTSAEIVEPTRVGLNPFEMDERGEYRCPVGDLIGLSLLSEVTVKLPGRSSADILCSRQFIGVRRGLLRPERVILVSPKVWKLIATEKLKGCGVEVAHLAEREGVPTQ
jgi:hypothetical protein